MQRPVAVQSKHEPARVGKILRIVFHDFTRLKHVPDIIFRNPPLKHPSDGVDPEYEPMRKLTRFTCDFTRI